MGNRWNGGYVNCINLPHRPTFTLEEKRGHQKPGRCEQIERPGLGSVIMDRFDERKTQ